MRLVYTGEHYGIPMDTNVIKQKKTETIVLNISARHTYNYGSLPECENEKQRLDLSSVPKK